MAGTARPGRDECGHAGVAPRSLKQMRLGLEAGSLRARGGTGSLSYNTEAADRVRQLLAGRDDVVEKRMVGGLSWSTATCAAASRVRR